MPRQADPVLESRILDAAQKLWTKGGARALTMRAVAKAARTTTPTVYQRFKNRQDILRGLVLRIREEIVQILEQSTSPEQLCDRYLHYGLTHPREYELFFAHEYEIFGARRESTYPGRELVSRKLATWLGGSPADHTRLYLALWAVLHGVIMLLIAKTVRGHEAEELRQSCRIAVRTILRNAAAINRGGIEGKI